MLGFPNMATEGERFFTAIMEKEDDIYVALCPELDIASQGGSIENALDNLREAVDLFLQAADPKEVPERRRGHIFVTQFLAARG
jgi:predicted RNase H-like HicB family nuclease